MMSKAKMTLRRWVRLFLPVFFVAPMLANAAQGTADDSRLTLSGEVVYVFDDDTILLDRKGGGEVRVRLNCPEIQTLSTKATSTRRADLGRLLLGQQVRVEGQSWDGGVLLGRVFTGEGVRVGEKLLDSSVLSAM